MSITWKLRCLATTRLPGTEITGTGFIGRNNVHQAGRSVFSSCSISALSNRSSLTALAIIGQCYACKSDCLYETVRKLAAPGSVSMITDTGQLAGAERFEAPVFGLQWL